MVASREPGSPTAVPTHPAPEPVRLAAAPRPSRPRPRGHRQARPSPRRPARTGGQGPPATRLRSARCGCGCGGAGGKPAGPPCSPRVRSWLLAALRGAGAPGWAPAASRGRPPAGAGPAAAALRTPAARRQRQQLQPHCPSSYFSDGSSRCCLGKRFSPLPETDFLHFISPHRPSGSKMLTFSGGRQTQLTLIYPSNGERLYYKPLAAIPRLGPSSSPLVPQTRT